MITKDNFSDRIGQIDLSKYGLAADDLRQGLQFIQNLESEGIDWKTAPADSAIGGMVKSLISLLNTSPSHPKPNKQGSQTLEGLGKRPKPETVNPQHGRGRQRRPFKYECDLIAQFVELNGKSRTRSQLDSQLEEIQQAIREGKIRKNNPFARDIMFIQSRLLAVINDMGPNEKRDLTIGEATLKDFKAVAGWKGRIPGEILLETFLRFQSEKAESIARKDFTGLLSKSLKHNRIRGKFIQPCKAVLSVLQKSRPDQKVSPGKKLFSQIRDALGTKKEEKGLAGTTPLIKVEQKTAGPIGFRTDQLPDNSHLQIPLSGKWLDLLGKPTRGFSAMVYGKPKEGKSTLTLELCGYLVRANLGNCLWIELEEDLRTTFKEKVDRMRVGHPDFRAWPEIPESLSDFDFVVINSVSEGKISPDQIRELKKGNPDASFILIYHTRKDGEFAGGQEHAHLVDVMVEVKDGRAHANGRFGRGETFVRFTADSPDPEMSNPKAA